MNQALINTGIPPALIFILGALLIPLFRGKTKSLFMLLIPVSAFLVLSAIPDGTYWHYKLLDYDLILGRVDGLSRPFGYIFILITFISLIYALKVKDDLQYMAGLTYAGSALGVTFAGDLFSLYIFWEFMAIASTFLILARRTEASFKAAVRYVLVHVFGGLSLLAGIALYVHQTGTTQFGLMELSGLPAWLIFMGIAVNAAIPPLHPWLKDAYPEATVAGAVFLSAFTTKSAVYIMARTFAGTELLIWLGVMMTCVPIFYAEIENDMRRVLSYSLMNQVGFMMTGIGIGTQLAINGTVSHAFAHILYKALLFMSVGAVLHVTGKIKATDLGGLYKTMPITTICCLVGALSISAFPLTSGFISKSMIISAAGHEHLAVAWLVLQFASAGVIAHAGIKVPFFTFFGHDSGLRAKEPPKNMLLAMGIAATACVYIGVNPGALYAILPYPVDYVPYTGAHVVGQLQLLMFGVLAFYLMLKAGRYPSEIAAINLDTDWFYRKGAGVFFRTMDNGLNGINALCHRLLVVRITGAINDLAQSAPARLSLLVLLPVRGALLKRGYNMDVVRKKVHAAFESGSVPIGYSAAAAGLFLLGVFILLL